MYNCGICHAKGINAKPALKYVELRADGSIAREEKICAGCHRGFVIRGYKPSKADRHTIVAQHGTQPANQTVVPEVAVSSLLTETDPVKSAPAPGTASTLEKSAPSIADTIEPVVLPKLTAPEDYTPKPLTVAVTLPKQREVPVAKVTKVVKPKPKAQVKPAAASAPVTPAKKPRSKIKIVDKSKTRKS